MMAIIIVIVAITAGVIAWMFAKKSQAPVQQVAIAQPASITQTQPIVQPSTPAIQPVVTSENLSVTLKSIEDMKGENPENFNNGPYLYLHGDISKVKSWAKLGAQTRSDFEKLLQNVPITKLDYSKNPNNVSDEILIGPIKNCEQYKNISEKIIVSKLSFSSKIAHGHGDNNDLEKCIDFSKFD